MTTPCSPGLPLPATTGREPAATAPAPGPIVRPKDDAEGVLSVLPFTVLAEQEASPAATAWAGDVLDVKMPFRHTPAARSTCACGRDRTAHGAQEVRALIEDHAHHRTVCSLRDTSERRTAA
ncbi:hypothetical protein N4G70_16510 [Streptomyces sp. ASQP_92]|uniref:hypothetical protein n=1 Tax=Streptomyces sp. ASQP_92 TaxID=2979116 RepID=UPI0021BDF763|nr:hypothetical protein [Streptomyces sp. ASQP_92]MCT9090456.1 hypothetical protein [Streptomyces sp. ASQP_92]